jgi:hypothetical protein
MVGTGTGGITLVTTAIITSLNTNIDTDRAIITTADHKYSKFFNKYVSRQQCLLFYFP